MDDYVAILFFIGLTLWTVWPWLKRGWRVHNDAYEGCEECDPDFEALYNDGLAEEEATGKVRWDGPWQFTRWTKDEQPYYRGYWTRDSLTYPYWPKTKVVER